MKRSYEDVLSECGNTAYDESSTIIIGDEQIINTPVKYEAVFGPQELFDCASDDAVLAIKDTTSGRIHIFTNGGWIKSGLKHERHIGTSDDQIAMRRIIKTPKRWTWEDKRAGWLPEVGCRVDFCHKLNTNWRTGEIKYIDNQVAVIKADDIDRPFVYGFDRVEFKPIETPAEKAQKAQREEDEFIDSLKSVEIHDGTVGSFFNQGARAAYRKLKGGE